MSTKPIMEFVIEVKPDNITAFQGTFGGVCFIPFTGHVDSDFFTGEICPGACDVQITNPAGYRTMCAQYIFEGTDREGKPCFLYVKNETYFTPDLKEGNVFGAVPTFITNSEALMPYFHSKRFRSEVCCIDENSIIIKIYDIFSV